MRHGLESQNAYARCARLFRRRFSLAASRPSKLSLCTKPRAAFITTARYQLAKTSDLFRPLMSLRRRLPIDDRSHYAMPFLFAVYRFS